MSGRLARPFFAFTAFGVQRAHRAQRVRLRLLQPSTQTRRLGRRRRRVIIVDDGARRAHRFRVRARWHRRGFIIINDINDIFTRVE